MGKTPHDPSNVSDASGAMPPTMPTANGVGSWPWLAGGLAVIIVAALIIMHIAMPQNLVVSKGLTPLGSSRSINVSGTCSPQTQSSISQAITLSDLAMVSPAEGWAAGAVTHFGGQATAGVILHYSHSMWQQIAGNFPNMEFDSISMISPADGWIGGVDTSDASLGDSESHPIRLLYHYDGQSWRPASLASTLFGDTNGGSAGETIVRMYSATDGWLMVRDATTVGVETILHFNGVTWRQVQTPFTSTSNIFSIFYDMAVTGPNDVWLAGAHTDDSGDGGGQQAILAHYQNGRWSTVANPPMGSADTLAMVTATQGWATDYNQLLSINDRQATGDPLPIGLVGATDRLISANAAPDGSLWVVGDSFPSGKIGAFLLHRDSNGVWNRITVPYDESMYTLDILAPNDIWAVGSIPHLRGCAPALVTEIAQGTILHWNGSQWSQVIEPTS
jgi:hypothetical protein